MPVSAETKWTEQQHAAITTDGCSLLVSAAAGSGKTAVLAERCAYLVCDAADPCDVDQLLVVTFTDAAAAEMKGRIETALRKRLDRAEADDDQRMQRQLALVERAQVSTLHGFCARLLRQHFNLLGLDPNFGILDGDEAALLRQEVVRDLFADHYVEDESGAFQALVDAYGDGNDEPLMNRVIHTHDLLQSLTDPTGWLEAARARLTEASQMPLRQSAVGRELAAQLQQKLTDLSRRCDEGLATLRKKPGFGGYVTYLANLKVVIERWIQAFGQDALDALAAEIKAFELPRMPSVPNSTPGKEAALAAVDAVRDALHKDARAKLGSLQNMARFTAAEWSAGLKATLPASELFLNLVNEFGKRYQEAKKQVRKLDFSDLEVFSLQVLCGSDVKGLCPSGVARACHRQFRHVLVDEYQDINEVQDAILRLVSRECVADKSQGNLFCVGDVKQSIYGFRLAEPARFLSRDRLFRSAKANGGKIIDLQSNFRSRGPLLDALNALFEQLMCEATAGINYDASQRLVAGLKYPPSGTLSGFIGAPVELHVLPRTGDASDEPCDPEDSSQDLDRAEREASFIAYRIHEMMGDMPDVPRMHVARKNSTTGELEPQPIRYRDIVILLRSMRYKADQFARVLNQHGIPTHRDTGVGYFNSMEVRDVLSLLHVLDNQRQDIPLAAVLRSPIAALVSPEDSLARIVLEYRDAPESVPFHEAVARYAAEGDDELTTTLRAFLKRLEEWRRLAGHRPLAELIWTLYQETGYLAFCSGLPNGEQRVANLIYLHERARQFGTFARQGLYRFLKFLESLASESDLGQPSVLSEADDVVRVMSVHRSKGLEFPVVFLPDLGKRINLASCGGPILVDRHAYLGLSVPDEERRVRYPSLASTLVQSRLREQAMAEELRVLYVATTRAREHLVLVGTADAKKTEQWKSLHSERVGRLPSDTVLGATSMLDWIGPVAAALAGSKQPLFQIISHTTEELNDWNAGESPGSGLSPEQQAMARLTPISPPPPADPVAGEVIERLTRLNDRAPFTKLAAAQSVTAWTKYGKPVPDTGDDDQNFRNRVFDQAMPLPQFLMEGAKLTATDIGTATHVALEHLDFSLSCIGADLEAQLQSLVQRKMILPAQAAVVDRQAIEWFIGTELGKVVRKHHDRLHRELPFHLAIAPARFDPALASPLPADQVMLRGRIDLVISQDDGLAVVDYKTDRVQVNELEDRAKFYDGQVQLYREALEKITAKKVTSVYLVFLKAQLVKEM